MPLTLIGVGIAWLVASNTGSMGRVVNDARVQAAQRRIGELAGDIGIGGGSSEGSGGQILGPDGEPLARNDLGRGNGWVHQAAGAAGGAISTVRDAGSAVLDRAGSAGDLASRASSQVTEKLSTDPWLIGIAGLVAGALLAAVLPPTSIEQDYIGEARDGLWNKANELGHEAAERVRELANSATRNKTHQPTDSGARLPSRWRVLVLLRRDRSGGKQGKHDGLHDPVGATDGIGLGLARCSCARGSESAGAAAAERWPRSGAACVFSRRSRRCRRK